MTTKQTKLETLPDGGSDRRREVLQTAAECFAQTGYGGTSMRMIATALGMRAGSLYSHFTSKQQMLDELMNSFFDELLPRQRAAFALEGTIAKRLSTMVDEVVAVCDRHRQVVMVIELDWHEIASSPELSQIVEKGRDTSTLFRQLLDEGVAAGQIRDDVDLDCVVRLLYSSIYGLLDRRFRQTGTGGRPINNFSGEQVAATLNALFAGGLLKPRRKATRP